MTNRSSIQSDRQLNVRRNCMSRPTIFSLVLLLAAGGQARGQSAIGQDGGTLAGGPPVPSSANAGNSAATPQLAEITVTGSRIVTNISRAPTPVTVIGSAELRSSASSNIADTVNQLPALISSQTTGTGTYVASAGTAGTNFLNLRGFGPDRTLVLLDGERVVPSTIGGIVDINVIPSALVDRVEIVTGGASAAYGSDAVTGVVNFHLNTRFEGFKLDAQGGETQYGDDRQERVDLAWGRGFAHDAGHIIAAVSYSNNDGALDATSRPWFAAEKVMPTPGYAPGTGLPKQGIYPNVGFAVADQGGLVTGGPLKGTTFGPNGQPEAFNYGAVGGIYMHGGGNPGNSNDVATLIPLDAPLNQAQFYLRASYDVSPKFRPFDEFIGSYEDAWSQTISAIQLGNQQIGINNAFLPDSVRAAMAADNVTSLPFGTTNQNLGPLVSVNRRVLTRDVAGADGDLGIGRAHV